MMAIKKKKFLLKSENKYDSFLFCFELEIDIPYYTHCCDSIHFSLPPEAYSFPSNG